MHFSKSLSLLTLATAVYGDASPQKANDLLAQLRKPSAAAQQQPTQRVAASKQESGGSALQQLGGRISSIVDGARGKVGGAAATPVAKATAQPKAAEPKATEPKATEPKAAGKATGKAAAPVAAPSQAGKANAGAAPIAGAAQGGCSVWSDVSKDLTAIFLAGGQCTDDARAAIRAIFHDCFPDGGCDGSLAIPAELSRSENSIMTPTVNKLKAIASKHKVGMADMFVFAGSHAVATCPGGPITQTFVGRKDATSPCPPDELPPADAPAAKSIAKFGQKGFSVTDLAALIGAHTVAKQFVTDPAKSGAATDTTPGQWDTLFYQQTLAKTAPFIIESDANLAAEAQVGAIMKRFAQDKAGFNAAFAAGMAKLGLLGSDKGSLTDCTSALPRAGSKRDMLTAPLVARV